MSRLIDADALYERAYKLNLDYIVSDVELRTLKRLLSEEPTAEIANVTERRKGHWVVDEDGNIECSECGHSGVGDYYCERCGADMREEKDNAEKQ